MPSTHLNLHYHIVSERKVMEGRAPRARAAIGSQEPLVGRRRAPPSTSYLFDVVPHTNEGASSASPRTCSPVVPLQHIEFALIRPVLSTSNITGANWVVRHVLPFLC